MLIGLYGGTFDPVHRGHIHVAQVVKHELNLAQIRMVLAARPGHREDPHAPVEHRWAMLQLACAEHEGLIADDIELQRRGISYTIDTVSEIHARGDIPCWILGQDAFATLPSWHRWQALLDVCNLVVVIRPGDERDEPEALQNLCRQHEVTSFDASRVGQIFRLQAPMLEISATQVREQLATQGASPHLLADPVYTYITQHKLYQTMENAI